MSRETNWNASVQQAIRKLRREQAALEKELGQVQETIRTLEELARGGGVNPNSSRLSAEGRAAISRAAKKRWREYRAKKRKPGARSQ